MKIAGQRQANPRLLVLCLDGGIPLYKPYRIGGRKVIAIEAEGDFVGEEVELVKEDT